MASRLTTGFSKVLRKKRIAEGDLLKGAIADANELFSLVVQHIQVGVPKNIPASTRAYNIARQVIQSANTIPLEPAQINDALRRFNGFMNTLSSARRLKNGELKTVQELQQFFYHLYQLGNR